MTAWQDKLKQRWSHPQPLICCLTAHKVGPVLMAFFTPRAANHQRIITWLVHDNSKREPTAQASSGSSSGGRCNLNIFQWGISAVCLIEDIHITPVPTMLHGKDAVAAERARDHANVLFRRGQHREAAIAYSKVLLFVHAMCCVLTPEFSSGAMPSAVRVLRDLCYFAK